jgi:phage tail protein X
LAADVLEAPAFPAALVLLVAAEVLDVADAFDVVEVADALEADAGVFDVADVLEEGLVVELVLLDVAPQPARAATERLKASPSAARGTRTRGRAGSAAWDAADMSL